MKKKWQNYDEMIEQQKGMIEELKIMNKDNKNWMKKYAKDVFKNKNRKPERGNDSRINSSFTSCTNENSRRPRPDMEYSHDSEMYDYDNRM